MFFRAQAKRRDPPPTKLVLLPGDTAKCRKRGSRYTGDREHQYNGRIRCMRIRGTMVLVCQPLLFVYGNPNS